MGSRREFSDSWRLIQATDERAKKLVIQEVQRSWLYYRLLRVGNIINIFDTLEVPMYTSPPAAGKWIDRGDTLPDHSTTAAQMGFWNNRYVVFPSGFDQLEAMQKEGDPNQLFDLSEQRAAELAWAVRRTLCAAVFRGTGGKQPDGLENMIEKAAPGAQVKVVSGVNKATKAWFRNQFVQLTSNFGAIAAGSTIPAGILAFLLLKSRCTTGTNTPSDFVTTKAVWEMFRRAMLEMKTNYSLITERKAIDYGHKGFMIDGSALAWDVNCSDDTLYALHLEDHHQEEYGNGPGDKSKFDTDLEDIGVKSPFEMKGSLGIAMHPKIKWRKLVPRSPYRHLQETEWTITSCNLVMSRMSDFGVAGSDNGSRWSTWS